MPCYLLCCCWGWMGKGAAFAGFLGSIRKRKKLYMFLALFVWVIFWVLRLFSWVFCWLRAVAVSGCCCCYCWVNGKKERPLSFFFGLTMKGRVLFVFLGWGKGLSFEGFCVLFLKDCSEVWLRFFCEFWGFAVRLMLYMGKGRVLLVIVADFSGV